MEITKDIKIMRIEVNGSVIGLDGITDINPPDGQAPYWTISYDNGHRVYATGQVAIDFKRMRRIKMSYIDEYIGKQLQQLEHLDKVLKTVEELCQKRLQPLEEEEEEEGEK